MKVSEFSQCNSEKVDETAASAEPDGGGSGYLLLFAAINAVLGVPERRRPTWDGIRIYTLFARHRRDGLAIPVRTRAEPVNGLVETRYCLRDIVAWVRWKLPNVKTALDKLLTLEKERAELAATQSVTPSDHQYKHRRLAEIEREVAALREHGHIAEPPAQVAEPVAVEGAAKVVATPAGPREERPMKRSALIRLMRKTYPQTDTWFAKTGPGTIQEAAKLPRHGMWDASAALVWAEGQTGKRAVIDDWPDVQTE